MPRLPERVRFRVSLLQILLCVTALACGYAMLQSTALLIMACVVTLMLILLVGLTSMIVLVLTIIEMLLYASEYLARGQFDWPAKRL